MSFKITYCNYWNVMSSLCYWDLGNEGGLHANIIIIRLDYRSTSVTNAHVYTVTVHSFLIPLLRLTGGTLKPGRKYLD